MSVHIFGVRHHGPGSARALRAALESLQPDLLLVEGPPDAEPVLPLLARQEMTPPVALLIYVPDQPHRAVFYPFTDFSPEWQALRYAFDHAVPARFMDLPQAIQLARDPVPANGETEPEQPAADSSAPSSATGAADADPAPVPATAERGPRPDPIAMLAQAAGYDEPELWWEREIEQRRAATGLFDGIFEAMSALRADLTPYDDEEAQREAHMRQTIRTAERDGYQRIAVVCGAWHAPAIVPFPEREGGHGVRSDTALLKGLKRVKVEATWIPWTNSRLSYRSGYGAGIASPGWYGHLWRHPDRTSIHWLTHAAHLLRAEGLDASSASVIEAVRLADTLAALRGLPMPGMAELHEAIETVLCNGDAAPMRLIRDRLEIGEAMGAVPAETPAVPLQRDLEAQQRRLRLPPTPDHKDYDFDLRGDTDRARSALLHRLRLLSIPWGTPQRTYGARGTFHELWRLQWHPEFTVALIEANVWGNTVASAAGAFTRHAADTAADLPALSALLDRVMLADLPAAAEHVLTCVAASAAVSADVRHLMDALPPLARVARYGDVRGTKPERVLPVITGLFERVLLGLPGACASLDDDAAAGMIASIDNVQNSIALLDRPDMRDAWLAVLRRLIDRDGVHGLVRGRCCRLLLEAHALDDAELQRLAGLALSPVNPADAAAAWIEGVLRGSGLLLLHQDALWRTLDTWLTALPPDTFIALLPLLRRAFSDFQPPERRAMGEKVKRLHTDTSTTTAISGKNGNVALDTDRANRVLPVLAHILGVQEPTV